MEPVLKTNKRPKGKPEGRSIAQGKWTPLWFLMPAIIVTIIVFLYPLLFELWISLRNVTLLNLKSFKYPFIGIENYTRIFSDPLFYSTLIRTALWTGINVFFHVVIGVFLAVLLNRRLVGKGLMRVLLILPWAIPQYIAAMTWRGMFNFEYGTINTVLTEIFGRGAAIPWLQDARLSFIAAIITNIWFGIPFMMMVALGGLQSIPQEYYEAADVDGASNWHKFWNITVPLLKPVMVPAIVLGVVWTFNMINVIYIITFGAASEESQILVSLVYKWAFHYFRYGYAAALSVIIFGILMLFSTVFIRAQKLDD